MASCASSSDVECLKSIGTSNHERARDRLHALLDELYSETGRYPMIYTSQTMWNRVVGGPRSFGRYPLWVACWKCRSLYMPKGWTEWQFWQVGTYRYSGLGGLDGNVFHATSLSRLRLERQRPIRLERGEPYRPAA